MYHASSLRHGVSERLRFEIFKRDSFTCKYCGKSSVPLTDKIGIEAKQSVAEKEVDRWLARDPHSYQRQMIVDRHMERILNGEQARAAAEVTRILDENLAEAIKRRKSK